MKTKPTYSKMFILFLTSFLLITNLLLSGCAKKPEPVAPVLFPHTIKYSGETLAAIAAWYTGSANNWQVIAAANPDLKPNKMKIGSVILIPEALLKRVDELPKKFLKNAPKPTNEKLVPVVKQKDEAPKNEETKNSDTATAPASSASSTSEVNNSSSLTVEELNTPQPIVIPETPTPDPVDSSVESLLMEPTPNTAPTDPKDRAKEDLIEEILKN
jgi:hypothetical protein